MGLSVPNTFFTQRDNAFKDSGAWQAGAGEWRMDTHMKLTIANNKPYFSTVKLAKATVCVIFWAETQK